MFVEFLSISIEGFKSISSLDFDFKANGIFLLRGKNGAGKTTLFDALYWCLYGTCLKNTNQDKVPTKEAYRDSSFIGTRVIVEFISNDKFYKVARHVKFKGSTEGYKGDSKLMIFEDGELRSEELHKNNQQVFINEVLGAPAKMFASSVLYGQRMKKFIESSAEDKREILADFFEVDWVDIAKESSITYLNKMNAKKIRAQIAIDTKKSEIANLQRLKDDEDQREKMFDQERDANIARLNAELNSITYDLEYDVPPFVDNLKELHAERKLLNDEFTNLGRDKTSIEHNNNRLQSNIAIYEKSLAELNSRTIETNCSHCGSKLKPESIKTVKQSIENSKSELLSKIEELRVDINVFGKGYRLEELGKLISTKDAQINSAQDLKDAHAIAVSKNANIVNSNAMLKVKEGQLKLRIEELRSSKFVKSTIDFTQEIISLEKDINILSDNLESLETLITDLSWLSKTAFGANGLKSYIINTMLEFLNLTIKKYASRLGLEIKFSIDLTGARKNFVTKCFKNGVETDYEELSGGEKARIDLSLSLGLFDLLAKIKTKYSVLIFDEAFEGLDEEGVFDLYDLLREASNDAGIYVITHNETMDLMGTEVIDVVKVDHLTTFA